MQILPQTYAHLSTTKQHQEAALIAETLFYTIAVIAAYSDDCNREALQEIWNKLIDSKVGTENGFIEVSFGTIFARWLEY